MRAGPDHIDLILTSANFDCGSVFNGVTLARIGNEAAPGTLSGFANKQPALCRCVDDADDGLMVLNQGNIDSEFTIFPDKFLGAINRINKKEGASDSRDLTRSNRFFCDNRNVRGDGLELGDDDGLGGLISARNRGGV